MVTKVLSGIICVLVAVILLLLYNRNSLLTEIANLEKEAIANEISIESLKSSIETQNKAIEAAHIEIEVYQDQLNKTQAELKAIQKKKYSIIKTDSNLTKSEKLDEIEATIKIFKEGRK